MGVVALAPDCYVYFVLRGPKLTVVIGVQLKYSFCFLRFPPEAEIAKNKTGPGKREDVQAVKRIEKTITHGPEGCIPSATPIWAPKAA